MFSSKFIIMKRAEFHNLFMKFRPCSNCSSEKRISNPCGAIINIDSSGYSSYMKAKSKKLLEREELDNMKQEISDIKEMLAKIAKKL